MVAKAEAALGRMEAKIGEKLGLGGKKQVSFADEWGSAAGAAERPASSAATQPLLRNQLIAEQIAKGHALEKHVVSRGEFPGWIRTRDQLKQHVEHVLNDPKTLSGITPTGKNLFYHQQTNTIVIYNPKAPDGGTVFQPIDKIDYFLRELKR